MIQIQVIYDLDTQLTRTTDDAIEAVLRPHCNGLECQGSGAGFGRRDIEFWADYIDPDVDLEMVLEPLFLKGLEVIVDDEYEQEED